MRSGIDFILSSSFRKRVVRVRNDKITLHVIICTVPSSSSCSGRGPERIIADKKKKYIYIYDRTEKQTRKIKGQREKKTRALIVFKSKISRAPPWRWMHILPSSSVPVYSLLQFILCWTATTLYFVNKNILYYYKLRRILYDNGNCADDCIR